MEKITHEQARKWVIRHTNIVHEQYGLDYITQQEKKDELLGLYREKNDTIALVVHGEMKPEDADGYMQNLNQQIKALETKLKGE